MIFLVWSLVLLFFKCGGRRRFGCASGSLPEQPTRPASMGPVEQAKGVSDDGDVPQSVRKWLETEQRREEDVMEEAESEIVRSARSGGATTAATSSQRSRVVPQSIPPEQAAAPDESDSYANASYSTHNAENVSPEIREARAKQREMESRRYVDSMRQFNRRVRLIRTTFLLAGVGILVSTALFYAKGLMSLKNSLESTQSTLEYGGSILEEAHNLTTSYLAVRRNVKEEVDNLRYTAQEFCPTGLGILESLNLTSNQTGPLQEQVLSIGSSLGDLGDMLEDEFESLQDDLEQMMTDVDQASSSLDSAYPFLWAGAGAVGAQIIITLCLMAEVIAASRGRKMKHGCAKCMRNVIILPLFFLFTVLAWLFASLFLLAAISGSDFCINPDKNIYTYLNAMVEQGRYSEVLVDYLAYFVKCVEARKPVDISESAEKVMTALGSVHNFTEYWGSDESVAIDVCTPVGAGLIKSLSSLVHTELHGVEELFSGLIDLMSCSTFNPLYSSAAYDALCINGVDGLNWMFGTQLAVAICAMVMITLRSARRESKDLQPALAPISGAAAGTRGKGISRSSSMNSRDINIGAKPAPWEAAAVAAFVAADASRPSSTAHSQQTQPEDENEENVEYVFPCEEEEGEEENGSSYYYGDEDVYQYKADGAYAEERPDGKEDNQEEGGDYADGDYADGGDDDAGAYDHEESFDEYQDGGNEEPYNEDYSNYPDEQDYDAGESAPTADGVNDEDGAFHDRSKAAAEHDANFELLETLTSDQVEAIENIGIEQAQSGRTYQRDELEVQLMSIPGLTEQQINAVIELELLTRV